MSDTQNFNYSVSRTQLITMVIVACAVPFLLAFIATDNQKDLRLFKLVTLSSSDASSFYFAMALLSVFAALTTIFIAFTSLRHPIAVELYASHANLPKASMLGGQLHIPYESITNISRKKLSATQEMLVIKSSAGESRLIASYFKDRLGYQDFLSALSEKITSNPPLNLGNR